MPSKAEQLVEILLEDRVNALVQKYGISQEAIELLALADPTSLKTPEGKLKKAGGYTDWLTRQYIERVGPATKKGGAPSQGNLKQQRFFREDLPIVSTQLGIFDRNKSKLKDRDINHYSLSELATVAADFDTTTHDAPKADKIYDKDGLLILIPRNESAAIKYGKGTTWCTAASSSDNLFKHYEHDPLFIIISKMTTNGDGEPIYEKYQLSFAQNQYMNAEDEPIRQLPLFLSRLPEEARKAIYANVAEGKSNEKEIAKRLLFPSPTDGYTVINAGYADDIVDLDYNEEMESGMVCMINGQRYVYIDAFMRGGPTVFLVGPGGNYCYSGESPDHGSDGMHIWGSWRWAEPIPGTNADWIEVTDQMADIKDVENVAWEDFEEPLEDDEDDEDYKEALAKDEEEAAEEEETEDDVPLPEPPTT